MATDSQADQFVDPSVSRTKFSREVDEYRAQEEDYRVLGWFLLEAEFPNVLVMMAARQLPVPAVVVGVKFDYTNYDADPPSVRLVDPFTSVPYPASALPTRLDRRIPGFVPPELPPGVVMAPPAQPYMQWYGPNEVPFLCLPGVREYHSHPGHSGDPWELHRRQGAGRLVRILNVIHRYGVEPIDNLAINLQLVPQIVGFRANPPE